MVSDPSECPVGDCMKKGTGDDKCRTSCRDHVLSKRDWERWDVGSERIPTLWGVHGCSRSGVYGGDRRHPQVSAFIASAWEDMIQGPLAAARFPSLPEKRWAQSGTGQRQERGTRLC